MIDYDPHDWWGHFLDVKGSMLREISSRVGACAVWTVLVVTFHEKVAPVNIPVTCHALVGVALGLLLVFRTNASYDRFWEGHKLWGAIVNQTRNLGRAARVYLTRDPGLTAEIVRWTAALPWATLHCLRGRASLDRMAAQLPPEEVSEVLAAGHVPLAVAVRLSTLIALARDRGLITDYVWMALDRNVHHLMDHVGGCERIQRTPLPFAYVVHLRRALILYCYSLPFAIVKDFDWMAVVAAGLVAYTFFGIEEIGVEIENPFGEDDNDLPLERLCETITGNLLELVDTQRPGRQENVSSVDSGPSCASMW